MANKNKLKKTKANSTTPTNMPGGHNNMMSTKDMGMSATGKGIDPRTGKTLRKHDISKVRGRKKPA